MGFYLMLPFGSTLKPRISLLQSGKLLRVSVGFCVGILNSFYVIDMNNL